MISAVEVVGGSTALSVLLVFLLIRHVKKGRSAAVAERELEFLRHQAEKLTEALPDDEELRTGRY